MIRPNARNVGSLEINSPLTEEEDNAIKTNIRGKYYQQIKCWALVQKASKKRTFFNFLKGAKPQKHAARPTTSLSRTMPGDLVIRGSSGVIDLNFAFNGRPCTRKINRERFASRGIIGQGIFNENPPPPRTVSTPKANNINLFILKKLCCVDAAERLSPIVSDYIDLLKELNEWVDKKCNYLPSSEITESKLISPNYERMINKSVAREDHLIRPGVTAATMPSHEKITKRDWHPPRSSYNDFFNQVKTPIRSEPFVPQERSLPFCQFPSHSEDMKTTASSAYTNQFKENTQAGQRFRSIFTSATVL